MFEVLCVSSLKKKLNLLVRVLGNVRVVGAAAHRFFELVGTVTKHETVLETRNNLDHWNFQFFGEICKYDHKYRLIFISAS